MNMLAWLAIISAGILSLGHEIQTQHKHSQRSPYAYTLQDYPGVVSLVRPVYSDEVLRSGRVVEGVIKLEVGTDRQGYVNSVRVLHKLGHGLDEEAIKAVQQWDFEPTGKPEKRKVDIGFSMVNR